MTNLEDLSFINWFMALERRLMNINMVIKDSKQHEDLSNQEIKLLEKMHELYYREEVTFGKHNLDSSKLKVV